jgi:hypothetical protein
MHNVLLKILLKSFLFISIIFGPSIICPKPEARIKYYIKLGDNNYGIFEFKKILFVVS